MQRMLVLPSVRSILGKFLDTSYGFFKEYVSDVQGFRKLLGIYEGIISGKGVLRFFLMEENKRDCLGCAEPGLQTFLEKTVTLYVFFRRWNLDGGFALRTALSEYGGMGVEGPVHSEYSCWRDGMVLMKIRIINGDAWDGIIDDARGTDALNVVTWKGMYCMMPELTLTLTKVCPLSWIQRDKGCDLFEYQKELGDWPLESVGELKGCRHFGDSYCLEYTCGLFQEDISGWVDPLEGKYMWFECREL